MLGINVFQSHRLFTHEDTFGIHKCLGLFCLGHFAYRGFYMWHDPTLGFDDSWFTLVFIWLHMMLHASSFLFVLPERRNKTYNIIWPEMRWHSMIFAYRSLLGMALLWLRDVYNVREPYIYIGRSALVLGTMVCADITTRAYKNEANSRTMRDNPYPKDTPVILVKAINYFYSMSQMFATMIILNKSQGHMFWTLVPIQTAPFLMTLVKKGILKQVHWHVFYVAALLLGYGYYYAIKETTHASMSDLEDGLLPYLFIVLRFGLNCNKYVFWTGAILTKLYRLCYT